MPRPRYIVSGAAFLLGVGILTLFLLRTDTDLHTLDLGGIGGIGGTGDTEDSGPHPIYKPTPAYVPPPVKDPFPALATSAPPPIPPYNVPEKDGWKKLGLEVAPPLLIGFTRSWPMLLQTVVSYIVAGWPPDQIYVVENTGAQRANEQGLLSPQHPFYLNHTTLTARLGVRVLRTPVLLSFAQLQNFYLALALERGWPYYFWSHMDVLALSHEDGLGDDDAARARTRAGQPGYRSLYARCLDELVRARADDPRWALRFFAYDHLTLQNPRALEDVGAWDTLIPYYMTDCDFYSRLAMRGWSQADANCGIITDTSSHLDDLRALYRDPAVQPTWSDPNPPDRGEDEDEDEDKDKRRADEGETKNKDTAEADVDASIRYWRRLRDVSDQMFQYKHGDRGRNTWQAVRPPFPPCACPRAHFPRASAAAAASRSTTTARASARASTSSPRPARRSSAASGATTTATSSPAAASPSTTSGGWRGISNVGIGKSMGKGMGMGIWACGRRVSSILYHSSWVAIQSRYSSQSPCVVQYCSSSFAVFLGVVPLRSTSCQGTSILSLDQRGSAGIPAISQVVN